MISGGPMGPGTLFSAVETVALLGRPLRAISTESGTRVLKGARVLVTGAAGSVGNALIARLAEVGASTIFALDHHEPSLFRLGRDFPDAPLDLVLTDVRNQDKLNRVLEGKRPDVVFHLAAYKHVPLGEYGPDEVVAVNVFGTQGLAAAAARAGVRHFVYPSSDKAVNPPSAYGATKRLAETLLMARTRETGMAVHVVRYVNIIGSAGSITETFLCQARAGQPLPLTDERMVRYWMAMDEALDLATHSLGLPSGSRTVLDVGGLIPTRIIGERIVRLVQGPDARPDITITGIRPGERLFEELASANERLEVHGDDPVLAITRDDAHVQADIVHEGLEELASLLANHEADTLHRRLFELSNQLQ